MGDARKIGIAAAACWAAFLMSSADAATVDLLASDPTADVAIYLKDFPTGLIETSVNLNNGSDIPKTDGTAGSTTVGFSTTGSFDAANGDATISGVGGNTTFPNLTVATLGSTFTDLTFGAQTPSANDLR